MIEVSGFDYVATPQARVLVLGSMPGVRSLSARQYYAHPQNVFWRLMQDLLGVPVQASYAQRLRGLRSSRVALWDVLACCHRVGSLDSAIVAEGLTVNDFAAFFASHSAVGAVFFNGAKSEQLWRRHVEPAIADTLPTLETMRLPSTSPAHAVMNYSEKLEAWSALLSRLE